MCNVKTKVFPLMIGENEITSKSFRKYLSNISGEHEVKKLQKKQPYWSLHTYFGKC